MTEVARASRDPRREHLDVVGRDCGIADMNSLEAEVDVNEANVSQLGPNQRPRSRAGDSEHTYKGVLRQIIPPPTDEATVTSKSRSWTRTSICAGDELQRDVPGAQKKTQNAEAARNGSSRAQRRGDHARRQAGGLRD